MVINTNQNPEQIARDRIGQMLVDANWLVQSKYNVDLSAGQGVAVREYQTDVGPADYVLFVDRKPVGIINNNHPKALIQMAIGAGKTFTAATFIYRLLKHADAKRVLFLVDTRNLGEQAEQEFKTFQPNDDNRKFTELYNVLLRRIERSRNKKGEAWKVK